MAVRYTCEWTTGSGGPGTSTFHLDSTANLQGNVNAIAAFFTGVASLIPTDVAVTFPGEATIFDPATGTLTGVQSVTPPATVAGSNTGSYAAPTGARVRWNTAGIVRGRRVTGTTFLVPLGVSAYQNDGSILGTAVTTMLNSATTMRTAIGSNLVVWSRPTGALPNSGTVHVVTGVAVPDRAAVLRSRRD